jgi:hypothetical protein
MYISSQSCTALLETPYIIEIIIKKIEHIGCIEYIYVSYLFVLSIINAVLTFNRMFLRPGLLWLTLNPAMFITSFQEIIHFPVVFHTP